ncbi:hypothetical protein EOL96_02635 [Candidatus Saccharibacteria bacterium]|nr:hypothetical protein [Candidatus Saccharibacteria bacterium]
MDSEREFYAKEMQKWIDGYQAWADDPAVSVSAKQHSDYLAIMGILRATMNPYLQDTEAYIEWVEQDKHRSISLTEPKPQQKRRSIGRRAIDWLFNAPPGL